MFNHGFMILVLSGTIWLANGLKGDLANKVMDRTSHLMRHDGIANEKHWYRKRENAKLQWCNTLLTAEYWVDLRENTGCNQELYINYDQLWQSWERDEITWQFPAFFHHGKLCIGYNYQAELKPTSQGTCAPTPRKAWRPTSSMRWWMRFWSRCWSAWRIAGEPHGDCTLAIPQEVAQQVRRTPKNHVFVV